MVREIQKNVGLIGGEYLLYQLKNNKSSSTFLEHASEGKRAEESEKKIMMEKE